MLAHPAFVHAVYRGFNQMALLRLCCTIALLLHSASAQIASLQLSPSVLISGATLTATVNGRGSSASASDWLGIFPGGTTRSDIGTVPPDAECYLNGSPTEPGMVSDPAVVPLPTSGLAIGSYELFLFHNDQEASTGVRANASFEVVLPPTIQLQAAMYVLIATVDGPSAVRGAGDRLAICPVASVVCATPIISRDLTGTSGAERIMIPLLGVGLAAGTYTVFLLDGSGAVRTSVRFGWEPLIPLISTDWNPNPPPPPPPPSPHVPFFAWAHPPPPSPPPELLTIQAGNQTTLQQTANGTDGSNVGVVVSIVAALVLLALFAIGGCWLFRRDRKDRGESKVVLSVEEPMEDPQASL